MKIYIAAIYINHYMVGQSKDKLFNEKERQIVNNYPHFLESYHYIKLQSLTDIIRKNNTKLFLDSGAFSAFTLGKTILLKDYVDYIHKNIDIIKIDNGIQMISVLDSLNDPQKTYENQLAMEKQGIKPIPCFHAGEDERYLEHYINNYEYVSLGGMVNSSTQQLTIWLDRMWNNYLIDGSGNSKVKIHGFGMTSISLMENYPWYSCDSSSWIQSASYGAIIDPEIGSIRVSEKSPDRHEAGKHILTMTNIEREHLERRIETQGWEVKRLCEHYPARVAYNLWSFEQINNAINKRHDIRNNKLKTQELF